MTARTSSQQQVNTFCKKSQCSWEAGNSLGVLAQIPLLNAASFLLICLQENAILQAQTRNFADMRNLWDFSSQDEQPKWKRVQEPFLVSLGASLYP